jgi:hypothetical protein
VPRTEDGRAANGEGRRSLRDALHAVARRVLYGRCHATVADFRGAIEETPDRLPTTHVERLKTVMTLDCQLSEDFSFVAA